MQAAIFKIAEETRVVDGIDGPKSHGNRGELPKIGHQPGMRVGRKAGLITQFMPEIDQVVFTQAAFEKRARINTGGSVALIINKIARLIAVAAAEEMVEGHFADGGQRGKGRDMAANVGVVFIGAHHHGRGVPANDAFNAAFERPVTRIRRFFMRGNGVQIRRVDLGCTDTPAAAAC